MACCSSSLDRWLVQLVGATRVVSVSHAAEAVVQGLYQLLVASNPMHHGEDFDGEGQGFF